ncbi:uncharacterized protein LOC122376087 isoform X2 [Amphibalanus amphitrite]|uniref:uncharacterized protein LOC122376087 isoform X2 n=1 Tax=Amphibalanus amphitrite TaxID=1232801 RepID=UPI001C8FDCB1|nr:uncharacterized protein LOC122376087 isoform X2 [Amphibalanus amphitrite]
MPVPKTPPPPPLPVTGDDFRKPRKSKALFVDSAFFSTRDHPTWEDQVKMARKIAASLSDATNRHSRGQTMYERRKKRSPRWIHQGGAPLTSEDYRGPTLTVQTKPLFELIMNPQGQLLDLESLRDKGVVINTESLSPELCAELISDLHSARGKGGQIFARRKKRSERWV